MNFAKSIAVIICIVISLVGRCLGVPSSSPCPAVLIYDTTKIEADRWYATIQINSDIKLTGFSLDIVLNRKANLLGNYVTQVSSSDNQEFTVQNLKQKISPGVPYNLKFFVKFNEAAAIPEVALIRLNGREICPARTGPPAAATPDTPRMVPAIVPTSSPPTSNEFFPGDRPGSGNPLLPPTSGFTCGVVAAQAVPLITGGQPTSRGDWPWHIALYQANGVYFCGGSLISKTLVVTAGHCVTRPGTAILVNPGSLRVILGKFYLKQSFDGEISKTISEIILHPDYNPNSFYSDIAILKFQDAVTLSSLITPVCLWDEQKVDQSFVVGRDGTVVGWGFDETGVLTDELSKALMPVVSELTCLRSNIDFFPRFTSNTTFCAGFNNGTSACNGDSGGGMVFSERSSSGATVWRLRGLVSVSVGAQNQLICDSSQYVIFTDVAPFVPWLRGHMT